MRSGAGSALRMVAWPAVLTLLVSVLRLVGEWAGWAPGFFDRGFGGGASPIGIVWLIPVFGWWFGVRLARSGEWPANVERAVLIPLVLPMLGVVIVLLDVCISVTFDRTCCLSLVGGPVAMLLSATAWPRLWRVMALYAVLARLPVVVIPFLAVHFEWGTHYEHALPHLSEQVAVPKSVALALVQLLIWIPVTVVVGVLAGAIGAGLCGGRRPD
jgi:hypothetical protein